jgi:hypothetical protein
MDPAGLRSSNCVEQRPHPARQGGVQHVYRFDNNQGASVIRTPFSYGGSEGLWELAVLRFHGPLGTQFSIDYSTRITEDVIGGLTIERVNWWLERIEALPLAGIEEEE